LLKRIQLENSSALKVFGLLRIRAIKRPPIEIGFVRQHCPCGGLDAVTNNGLGDVLKGALVKAIVNEPLPGTITSILGIHFSEIDTESIGDVFPCEITGFDISLRGLEVFVRVKSAMLVM